MARLLILELRNRWLIQKEETCTITRCSPALGWSGDFSIGPHADVNYGHHPLSVNFYVPLTPIQGTSSLYIESTSGQMDWHPILGDYGEMQHFAGGMNTHWTTENMTARTRVSLDFRVIHGEWYDALVDGHDFGGAKDVYQVEGTLLFKVPFA